MGTDTCSKYFYLCKLLKKFGQIIALKERTKNHKAFKGKHKRISLWPQGGQRFLGQDAKSNNLFFKKKWVLYWSSSQWKKNVHQNVTKKWREATDWEKYSWYRYRYMTKNLYLEYVYKKTTTQ